MIVYGSSTSREGRNLPEVWYKDLLFNLSSSERRTPTVLSVQLKELILYPVLS